MNDTGLIIALYTCVAVGFALGIFWGQAWAKRNATPITIESIEKYVSENFPNEWAAYKRGITEGYEQGLRDGQEPFA